jgi:hypothetical protein
MGCDAADRVLKIMEIMLQGVAGDCKSSGRKSTNGSIPLVSTKFSACIL